MTTTNDDDLLIARLRAAMAEEIRGHHLDGRAAVDAALAQRHDSRRNRAWFGAVAASVLAVVAVTLGYAAMRHESSDAPAATASCAVHVGVLPPWARDGFSDSKPVMPYVLSDRESVIAILWSREHPLNSPAMRDQNNKILWVSPSDGAPLVIHAHLGSMSVTREVAGGPGPSIIDMPRSGCWTFDLTWGHHHDTIRLPYGRP